MSATQKPINSQIFGQVYETPAWKDKPCWYLIATDDQAINPALQRVFAERLEAATHEIQASHVPFASQPAAVSAIIKEAAEASTRARDSNSGLTTKGNWSNE